MHMFEIGAVLFQIYHSSRREKLLRLAEELRREMGALNISAFTETMEYCSKTTSYVFKKTLQVTIRVVDDDLARSLFPRAIMLSAEWRMKLCFHKAVRQIRRMERLEKKLYG